MTLRLLAMLANHGESTSRTNIYTVQIENRPSGQNLRRQPGIQIEFAMLCHVFWTWQQFGEGVNEPSKLISIVFVNWHILMRQYCKQISYRRTRASPRCSSKASKNFLIVIRSTILLPCITSDSLLPQAVERPAGVQRDRSEWKS